MLHSPNLHLLFILTWSTDATWWFVSLTYIFAWVTMVRKKWLKLILQYLWVIHSTYLHQLFILTWSTDVTACVLDLHFMLQWPRHNIAKSGPLWWFMSCQYFLHQNLSEQLCKLQQNELSVQMKTGSWCIAEHTCWIYMTRLQISNSHQFIILTILVWKL